MSVTETKLNAAGLPIGHWKLDPVPSSAGFAVKHMAVAWFRGRFETLDAYLNVTEDTAELHGNVDAGSIVVKDPGLQAHLASPDFFDIEHYPEITFHSRTMWLEHSGDLVVDGELTMKGHTRPIEGRGTIEGPGPTSAGAIAVGITLETTIDRTQFGLLFSRDLPGGGVSVANDVKLTIELELLKTDTEQS